MMSDLEHVVVLAGGLSYERDVSLRSGRRVAGALRALGVDAQLRDADAGLIDALTAAPPDAVLPVLHGASGEDGSIRDVLELIGTPYVGARPDACRAAGDKPTAKAIVRTAGLSTPDSVALPRELFHDLGAAAVMNRIVARLGLPLFVKPARGVPRSARRPYGTPRTCRLRWALNIGLGLLRASAVLLALLMLDSAWPLASPRQAGLRSAAGRPWVSAASHVPRGGRFGVPGAASSFSARGSCF
jgi:hypothetical protein